MTTSTAALTLWLLMDPLGNLPVFTSVLKGVDPRRRQRVVLRELAIALAFLVAFLFLGRFAFSLLALRPECVSIAGGLILTTIAFRMLFPGEGGVFGIHSEGEPLVFPLAVPLIAGPSTLSLLLLLSSSEPGRTTDWLAALGLAWLGVATVLSLTGVLGRILGTRGLAVVERLMGMLLICLAVQMLVDGARALLNPV